MVVNIRTLRAVLVAALALALLAGVAYAAESEAPTEDVAPDIVMVMIPGTGEDERMKMVDRYWADQEAAAELRARERRERNERWEYLEE